MAEDEIPRGGAWTHRWWRLPGESLFTQRVNDADVSVVFDYCRRDEWGFVFRLAGKTVQSFYDVDSQDFIGVQAIPREVVLAFSEQVRVRAKGIGFARNPTDPILSSIAARFAVSEWTTGKRLRRQLGVDVSDFRQRIDRLKPRYVRATRIEEVDYYSLTLPGLLACTDAIPAERTMEALYDAIAYRFNDDPDHEWFGASDLARFGISEEDLPLAKNIARTCLLIGGSDDPSTHRVFGMPADAETIAEQRKRGLRFQEYLSHAATERQRNEHYCVTRPWRTAPLWISRDGSQPDFLPAGLLWQVPQVQQPERSAEEEQLVIPGYELLERMQAGAAGEVHHAKESRDGGVERAIKVFVPHPFADEQDPEPRFRSEVESLYRLQHRAIVRYVYSGVVNKPRMFYLVMELVKGATLTSRYQSMTFEARVAVIAEVLDGLEHAHQSGIYHRDVKPSNIVIRDSDNQPVLVDFGLAYLVGDEKDDDRTRTVMGTPGYIPPETVKEPKRSRDPRHDVYQAGVTLYVILSGHLPPDSYLGVETVDARLVNLDPVVRRAIASDPEARYGSAIAFATALREWLAEDARRTVAMTAAREESLLPALDFSRALELQTRQLAKEEQEGEARRKRVEGAILVLAPTYEEIRSRLIEIATAAKSAGLPVTTSALMNSHPVAISLSALKEKRDAVSIFECSATPARGVPFTITLTCEYRSLVPTAWPLRFLLTIAPGPDYSNSDVIHLGDGSPLSDWARQPTNGEHFPALLQRWLAEPAHWAEFDLT